VLVTRPRGQTAQAEDLLHSLGAEAVVQPAIEIGPPADWGPVDEALGRLAEIDWLVFSSTNGVQFFLDRLWTLGRDLRALGRLRLAAIGPETAAELARRGLRVDRQPASYRAEALADELLPEATGQRFLLVRASRGRELLAERLQAAGADVRSLVVYESRDVDAPDEEVSRRMATGQIDWTLVTSSSIARSLVRMFGADLGRTRLASISPVTSEVLRGLGFPPHREATTYTLVGLIEVLD
jgi:uroporphyrinogen III methyltransferase/synthase